MTREERLSICKVCKKRAFHKSKGVVCSLTDDWADFEGDCPTFEVDEAAIHSEEHRARKKIEQMEGTGEISGPNIGIGILMIVGGVAWLIGGLAADRIFFGSFFLIGYGVIRLFTGK